jgi:hypothetical protein
MIIGYCVTPRVSTPRSQSDVIIGGSETAEEAQGALRARGIMRHSAAMFRYRFARTPGATDLLPRSTPSGASDPLIHPEVSLVAFRLMRTHHRLRLEFVFQ